MPPIACGDLTDDRGVEDLFLPEEAHGAPVLAIVIAIASTSK